MAAGELQYVMVPSWLCHRRSWHYPVLSGDGHTLAGLGDHEPCDPEWTDNLYRSGNCHSRAADVAKPGVEDCTRHVAYLDDWYGSGDERDRFVIDRRRHPDLVGSADHAGGWLCCAASLQLLAIKGAWKGMSLK